ncbi:MAG: efflux RND transporter periplasmic adaptor subunit [Gemmatimonadota bacterium]|nr:MAG: efflux RND transporter periplasmic adaptor subunit [Gemmatimonadota bacterium]
MISRSSRSAPLASALVFLLAAACSRGDGAPQGSAGGPFGRGGAGRETVVAVVPAELRDLARTVTVTGPIEPIRTVSVNAQMAGTLLRVLVEEGDRVEAGQLMAELDARETSAQLERARAVLANAEAAFQRAQQLNANGLSTQAELDAARSTFEIARADVELWNTRLAFSRIAAPASGVVTAKQVEQGSAVSTNQALFEIADDSLLVVRVRVSELDVVHLQPGTPATLLLDAYPAASIEGRIRRIFPSADAVSRLVPVEVALGSRPPGVEVRPGFLARVEFALDRREDVLSVPASAIGVADGGTFVYVVDADTLIRRPVETGLTAVGWMEITRGLEPGEPVVTSGHVNLRPGAVVRVGEELTTGADRR